LLPALPKALVRRSIGLSASLGMVVVPFASPLYLAPKIPWQKNSHLSRDNRAFVNFLLEQPRGYSAMGQGGE
jgi:hypothetical protein